MVDRPCLKNGIFIEVVLVIAAVLILVAIVRLSVFRLVHTRALQHMQLVAIWPICLCTSDHLHSQRIL